MDAAARFRIACLHDNVRTPSPVPHQEKKEGSLSEVSVAPTRTHCGPPFFCFFSFLRLSCKMSVKSKQQAHMHHCSESPVPSTPRKQQNSIAIVLALDAISGHQGAFTKPLVLSVCVAKNCRGKERFFRLRFSFQGDFDFAGP